MKKRKNNGGPAFPGGERFDREYALQSDGMTLRDWFAGQALAGLLANANLLDHLNAGDDPLTDAAFAASIARGCRVYADAMLEERSK